MAQRKHQRHRLRPTPSASATLSHPTTKRSVTGRHAMHKNNKRHHRLRLRTPLRREMQPRLPQPHRLIPRLRLLIGRGHSRLPPCHLRRGSHAYRPLLTLPCPPQMEDRIREGHSDTTSAFRLRLRLRLRHLRHRPHDNDYVLIEHDLLTPGHTVTHGLHISQVLCYLGYATSVFMATLHRLLHIRVIIRIVAGAGFVGGRESPAL